MMPYDKLRRIALPELDLNRSFYIVTPISTARPSPLSAFSQSPARGGTISFSMR